jgi:hypothetical protein
MDASAVVVSTKETHDDKYTNEHYHLCSRRLSEAERFRKLLVDLPVLSKFEKQSIDYRFIYVLEEFTNRCKRYSFLFHLGHFLISVGSLIVPALLSVQYANDKINIYNGNIQAEIYWVTWVISLLVTMSNAIIVLYKVDKKYYFLHTTRERLRSEGWQYFQLAGRYSELNDDNQQNKTSSHKNNFKSFCFYIERIRMRQIEEEYYKHEESNQTVATKQNATQNSLYPTNGTDKSLNKNLTTMYEKNSGKKVANQIIKDTNIIDDEINEDEKIKEKTNVMINE